MEVSWPGGGLEGCHGEQASLWALFSDNMAVEGWRRREIWLSTWMKQACTLFTLFTNQGNLGKNTV